ncbi:MAG: acetyl-CoA carboxylase biotin carboxyl carrier protein subunit, partial [Pseudomonadota bacterium]|nr:acetyl-CoA carboxylase biotin carboxyl carrier protein subunit [Pseudomonadota bacterium]
MTDRMLDVASEVAGTVLEISAAPGAVLAEGDQIMVLESMKMEIPVLAETAGRL